MPGDTYVPGFSQHARVSPISVATPLFYHTPWRHDLSGLSTIWRPQRVFRTAPGSNYGPVLKPSSNNAWEEREGEDGDNSPPPHLLSFPAGGGGRCLSFLTERRLGWSTKSQSSICNFCSPLPFFAPRAQPAGVEVLPLQGVPLSRAFSSTLFPSLLNWGCDSTEKWTSWVTVHVSQSASLPPASPVVCQETTGRKDTPAYFQLASVSLITFTFCFSQSDECASLFNLQLPKYPSPTKQRFVTVSSVRSSPWL